MADEQTQTREEKIENRIDRQVAGALALTGSPGGPITIAPQNMGEMMEFAKMMAISGVCVRPQFRGNPGACLAICMQAFRWGFDPFAVANKAYIVRSKLTGEEQIAFEAQLIHAVINGSPLLLGRLKGTYTGEGPNRACLVTGRVKGEEEPLEYPSPPIGRIAVKNSPLWQGDPDQQLWYFSTRAWARRHLPEVLLGCYTPEELRGEVIDMEPVGRPLVRQAWTDGGSGDDEGPPQPAPKPQDFAEKPSSEHSEDGATDTTDTTDAKQTPEDNRICLVDADGTEHLYDTALEAYRGLVDILAEAGKLGTARLEATWDDNRIAFQEIAAEIPDLEETFKTRYEEIVTEIRKREAPPEPPAPEPTAQAAPQQPARPRGRPPKQKQEQAPSDATYDEPPLPGDEELLLPPLQGAQSQQYNTAKAKITKLRAARISEAQWERFKQINHTALEQLQQLIGPTYWPHLRDMMKSP